MRKVPYKKQIDPALPVDAADKNPIRHTLIILSSAKGVENVTFTQTA